MALKIHFETFLLCKYSSRSDGHRESEPAPVSLSNGVWLPGAWRWGWASLNSADSRLVGMTKNQGPFALGDSLEASAMPALHCLQRQRPGSRSETLLETENTLFSESCVCAPSLFTQVNLLRFSSCPFSHLRCTPGPLSMSSQLILIPCGILGRGHRGRQLEL